MKLKPEQERILAEIQKERGFEFQNKAMDFVFSLYTGKELISKELPQGCQICPQFALFLEGKVFCILKLENKHSSIKRRSLIEAQACSKVPTLITLERKDDLVQEIHNAESREKYWKEQAEKLRVPQEQLLREKHTLESTVSEMQNALLRRDEEINALESNKAELTKKVTELSQGTLFEENQFLKVELGREKEKNKDYALEIEKSEALREKEAQDHKAIMSKVNDALRDIGKYEPPEYKQCEDCTSAFAVYDYLRGIKKSVEELQTYLAVATS